MRETAYSTPCGYIQTDLYAKQANYLGLGSPSGSPDAAYIENGQCHFKRKQGHHHRP